MREALKGVFPHRKWQQKVVKMSEAQVVAVYHNLKQQNKL
jgi:hypothetical protein